MKRIALWGPSEHEREEDRRRLAVALAAKGIEILELPIGSPPPTEVDLCVINSKTTIDATVLDAMPRTRFVVTTTSGYDHIDLDAAASRRVRVVRCPLARRDAVIDTSIAMALSLHRRLPWMNDSARDGAWVRRDVKHHPIPSIRDVIVGVIGLGVIGSQAAKIWRSLGATVLGSDPARRDADSQAELLEKSHIVTLHCSLSATSVNLIDSTALASMRPGAILVNTARGDCVDLEALAQVEHLGGVGLDVFPTEPPSDLAAISRRTQTWVAPHSAGFHSRLGEEIHRELLAIVDSILASTPIPFEVTVSPNRDNSADPRA